MNLRPLGLALTAGAFLILAAVGPLLAAVQRATLSLDAAPPGSQVTLHVESTARYYGTKAGFLILVPQVAFELAEAAGAPPCESVEGATLLGDMTWQAAPVAFGDVSYPGFVGDAQFTVPQVPAGVYYLAESIDTRGTGCHFFTSFTVTTRSVGDTAIRPHAAPLALAGAAAVLLATALGARLLFAIPLIRR